MASQYPCPSCGTIYSGAAAHTGEQVRCSHCGQMFRPGVSGFTLQDEFDPYSEWLSIKTEQRPPDHYQLLGIDRFEDDPRIIEKAAEKRMLLMRDKAAGKQARHSQQLLNELSKARICLLDTEKKSAYDAQLKQKTAPKSKSKPSALAPVQKQKAAAESKPEPFDDEEMPAFSVNKDGRREESEMDMTPMVDVTFLLLIFFMVTAAFNLQKTLPLPAPENNEPSSAQQQVDIEENSDFIIVRVDRYNTFFVSAAHWDEEREAPTEQDLLVLLREAKAGSGGKVPTKLLVVANGEAVHEKIVTALDAGSALKMQEVQLQTVEEDE